MAIKLQVSDVCTLRYPPSPIPSSTLSHTIILSSAAVSGGGYASFQPSSDPSTPTYPLIHPLTHPLSHPLNHLNSPQLYLVEAMHPFNGQTFVDQLPSTPSSNNNTITGTQAIVLGFFLSFVCFFFPFLSFAVPIRTLSIIYTLPCIILDKCRCLPSVFPTH